VTIISRALPAPVPTSEPADPRNNLVGLAKVMAEVDRSMPVHDLYDETGSELYDALGWQSYDTVTAVKLAVRTGGAILDLACGTGRIGLAVAQRGIEVVGVDLSTDMLDRFRARLATEPPSVAGLVELAEADMHSLDLGRRFRLAVLGATTIVLIDPAKRRAFFERVRSHLEPGGTFALDFHSLDLDAIRRCPRRTSVIEIPMHPAGAGYAVCCQEFDLATRREKVSFVVERVSVGGTLDRRIVTTTKAVLRRRDIERDLIEAGFDLLAQAPRRTPESFEWLIAEVAR
jgi:ubiquinone/menaquinone biosynthesis C-methylase UbiE